MIPVNEPQIGKKEIQYVTEALVDNAVSGNYGKFINAFENKVKLLCGRRYGISTSSGTAALHLALLSLNIGKDDEVIIPNLTMAATAFVVKYVGAKPILVDIDRDTWCIDTNLIEEKITEKTKAIIPVHLYGNSCNMDGLYDIADKYNLEIIEDNAEALGAKYKGWHTGGFGMLGCHSFYSTKMVCCGEGGMITTSNDRLAKRIKNLKNMAFGNKEKYLHEEIGYNYRMTNIQAAMGLAQMRQLNDNIGRKRNNHNIYYDFLEEYVDFQKETNMGKSVRWVTAILVPEEKRKIIRAKLFKNGFQTGDIFTPMNHQPFIKDDGEYPVSEDIYKRGFLLPSSLDWNSKYIWEICEIIKGEL